MALLVPLALGACGGADPALDSTADATQELATASNSASNPIWDKADVKARSAPIAAGFQAELQAELKQALINGGPIAAVSVCEQAAPAIAAKNSEMSGAIVRRIAERNRNASAGLDADMQAFYADLAARPMEDGKPATRIWQSGQGKDAQVHYLSAIVMKDEPCAICHGTAVDPKLDAHIKALYPEDRATGFSAGELRGALLISWPMQVFEEG